MVPRDIFLPDFSLRSLDLVIPWQDQSSLNYSPERLIPEPLRSCFNLILESLNTSQYRIMFSCHQSFHVTLNSSGVGGIMASGYDPFVREAGWIELFSGESEVEEC